MNEYWLLDLICDQASWGVSEGKGFSPAYKLDEFQRWVAEMGWREGEWLRSHNVS
jgi:hypothetical protein